MPRRLRTALAAAAAASGALLAPILTATPTSALATTSVASTVKIVGSHFGVGNSNVEVFGRVTSRKGFCEKWRTVRLKQIDQDIVVRTDRTNDRGKWAVVFDGNKVDPGTFRAIVERKVVERNGKRFVCESDTHTMEVGPGA